MKAVWIASAASAALLALAGGAQVTSAATVDGPNMVPERVSDFQLTDTTRMAHELYYFNYAPAIVLMSQTNGSPMSRTAAAEMAKLQTAYAGKPVEVVAISIDSDSELDKAKAFIAAHAPLKFYNDPKMKLPFAFTPPAAGMPTTVIYGADGVERGRLSGGADWSGPDAKAIIDAVLSGR